MFFCEITNVLVIFATSNHSFIYSSRIAMANIYYSIIGLLAVIIHIIINHKYFLYKDGRRAIKDYRNFLFVIFCYFITDAAWGILYDSKNIPLLYIDTVLYYIAMAFSVVLCCKSIISFLGLKSIGGKLLNGFGMTFAVGVVLVLIVNHFNHIFFWFDDHGVYHAYTLRNITLAIQFIMFGVISLMSFTEAIKAKQILRNRNTTICLFSLCMMVALILQTIFPLLPLYSIGLTIGTLIIHVFIYNEDLATHMSKIEDLNVRLQEEQAALMMQKDDIATALGIINGLSLDYHTIWYANKEDMKLHMLRAPGKGVIPESVKLAFETQDGNEAIKQYIQNYVVPEDRERLLKKVNIETVLDELSKNDFYAVNYLRQKPNGETDYNQIAFANADTADGRHQLVFGFRDINDILRQEMALRKELNDAKLAAEAANAAKTSFLFNMSHDIRTPMNAIIGFRNLLEKNQEDPEKRASYLRKIEESSNVLLSIINNVLEMARIEKGVLELDETAWSAEQFNDTLYSVFIDMMTQKGLEFTREIKVKNNYVYCDTIKLREVFINILSNAYKYTKPGGKVHMLIEEIPSEREGFARYRTSISDTGIGMTEDFIPHMFEEFTRETNSTMSKIEGTGLGMPIVKRLVDFMGGTIEVKSKKDVGTTFIVTIDHRIAKRVELSKVDTETHDADFESKRILLAEDNELNAEIAIAVLSEFGFEIERAADGQECVDMLKKADAGYYDVILMDIQMPHMNGYEATKAIRAMDDEKKSQIAILAMTANAFEEDKREALKVGMNGHLAKPINVRELLKELKHCLN